MRGQAQVNRFYRRSYAPGNLIIVQVDYFWIFVITLSHLAIQQYNNGKNSSLFTAW